jgi:hypothetical protein
MLVSSFQPFPLVPLGTLGRQNIPSRVPYLHYAVAGRIHCSERVHCERTTTCMAFTQNKRTRSLLATREEPVSVMSTMPPMPGRLAFTCRFRNLLYQ